MIIAARPWGHHAARPWAVALLLLVLAAALAGCYPFGRGGQRRVKAAAPPPSPAVARLAEPRLPPPRPSPKHPGRLPYDSERPCFTRDELARAQGVLFRGRAVAHRGDWLQALNRGFFELEADCTDPNLLLLVLTLIQQESGARVDPPLENRDLEQLLEFKLERLARRRPLTAKLLSASGIEQALKNKLRRDNRNLNLITEGDLVRYVEDDLKVWFREYLHKNYGLPEPIALLAAEVGIPSPVSTLGPMQVNVGKAHRNARERGEEIGSRREMRGLLLDKKTALARGLKEGIFLAWKSYRFYRERLRAEQAVTFAAADYNSGEFSSRNAAFQERVAALSGKPLRLDGDLLIYHEGRPQDLISNTEHAVVAVVSQLEPAVIRKHLLLEKQPGFSGTLTAELICRRYQARTSAPCAVARLPAGAGNETARIKTGRSYSPERYARAFLARFRKNRELFAARR
ncbi:MAG: DUF1615 family protein [SAR324 cluster bacterium]|nr:DUF1615 family protein [SAR324 cluster bacterium]